MLYDDAQMATFWRFFCALHFSSRVQHVSNLHPKFALRPHHVWKYDSVYTIQPVVKPVVQPGLTTGWGCQTRMTTGCIVQMGFKIKGSVSMSRESKNEEIK